MFLTRIREQSSYPALRGFLDTIRIVVHGLGILMVFGGMVSVLISLGSSGPDAQKVARAVGSVIICISGGVISALSHVAYQASILAVDIADTLIDERIH